MTVLDLSLYGNPNLLFIGFGTMVKIIGKSSCVACLTMCVQLFCIISGFFWSFNQCQTPYHHSFSVPTTPNFHEFFDRLEKVKKKVISLRHHWRFKEYVWSYLKYFPILSLLFFSLHRWRPGLRNSMFCLCDCIHVRTCPFSRRTWTNRLMCI